MKLTAFADIIHRQIRITYYPNQDGRFSASFDQCEIKDGICLKGSYGDGKSPMGAMNNYAEIIQGQIIVFNAMREDRAEYRVPKLIEVAE